MLNPDGYDLVVMDALPLFQLGRIRRLDLLLGFSGSIFISDEVAYEATEFFDQSQPVIQISIRIQIRAWLNEQAGQGRVLIVKTLVGEAARGRRRAQAFSGNHDSRTSSAAATSGETWLGQGSLAGFDLLNHIDQLKSEDGQELRGEPRMGLRPVLLLVGASPTIRRLGLNDLEAEVVGTYDMLVHLERSGLLVSADEVWGHAQ